MMMFALVLTAIAGAGILHSLETRAARDMESRGRAAGALFAQWFRAAHHLAQSEEAHYRNLVALHGGVRVPSSAIRSAGLIPDWMSIRTDAGQTISLGSIDDGHGVPMAFAVATPRRALSALYLESFVAGAAENQAGDIAGPGRNAPASRWQPAIERMLGRSLEPGELFATADTGIANDRRVVYRRAQPGRGGGARMETSLHFGDGAGITGVGELDALDAEVQEGLTVGTLRTGAGLIAASARAEGDVRTRLAESGDVTVNTSLNARYLHTGVFGAGSLSVETELSSHRVRSSGALSAAGTSVVNRDLVSLNARVANLAGERVDAWGASGTLEARNRVQARYSVGERAVFSGPVSVRHECAGC